MSRAFRSHHNSSGTAQLPRRKAVVAVEFAVVCPLLIMLILGIIEFGRIMLLGQLASNTARAAARVGSISTRTNTNIKQAASDSLDPAGIKNWTASVLVNDVEADASTAGTGDKIEVRIGIPLDTNGWLPTPIFVKGGTVTGSSILRRE